MSRRSSAAPESRRPGGTWLIREVGWEPKRQDHFATVLALGNGTIGSRSVLEESPAAATPGAFLAGVFDAAGSVVDDLVNLPDPFELRVFVNGQRLTVDALRVLAHERTLDMRRGLLNRRTVFLGGRGGRFVWESERFVSRAAPDLMVLRGRLTALGDDARVRVAGDFGLGAFNTEGEWEGRKRHFAVERVRWQSGGGAARYRMTESGIPVGCAWTTLVGGRRVGIEPVELTVARGRSVTVTRMASLRSGLDEPAAGLERSCGRAVAAAIRLGVAGVRREHLRAWDELWRVSAVDIAGDREIERAARFSIYHLLICGTDRGAPAGIGAKSLSGEGYRGHSFWDTEVYTLPFYAFNHPGMARQLVRYRIGRLGAARTNARARGFRGALFPWESGRTGFEATPWFPSGNGRLVLFDTGKYQHHISGDVALGLMTYWTVTGDEDLMAKGGFDLLAETARFWASRVRWDRRQGRYVIETVIGPDEYHVAVDNNAYTNLLARWNLETAADRIGAAAEGKGTSARRLRRALGLKPGELAEWRRIAGLIKGAGDAGGGIVEQFDGFFKRRDVRINRRTKHGMPDWPTGVTEDTVGRTQLSKQADVVLAMLQFPDRFPLAQKVANFRYYEPRTLHMSSLSASAYARAGLAWNVGDYALRYFTSSLFMDLNDMQGNTEKGMHIACCGGNWQTLIQGFGGVGVNEGRLSIRPKVPRSWRSLAYRIVWRGVPLRVLARPAGVVVANEGRSSVNLEIAGRWVMLAPGDRAGGGSG